MSQPRLSPPLAPAVPEKLQINVIVIMQGRKFSLEIDKHSTGDNLQEMIGKSEGLNFRFFQILFNGKRLDCTKRLLDQGLFNNAEISIVWREYSG